MANKNLILLLAMVFWTIGTSPPQQTQPVLSVLNKNHQPQPNSSIHASVGATLIATADIQVSSRPAVLVHGFGSSAAAWTTYLGDQGFLASIGVRGFAIGDSQVPGKLNFWFFCAIQSSGI